ncbi:iron-sulfur-dependent L-serine dehydratase alpha subunit [Streptohalobacillus salinus]|uniref:L-serine dehydratase n=1 Tax=Streptohalobacillus salinus TaxID=621096 RepID=A0A2V3WCT4_9BACI|nr:L-serine ammonia-lyase, iron-sulfur-dependent, subunit alpha [Streptohalobacillus salinus]PXW92566.1 iron-sulfur-dependent L-serine dehydratase alpha subunit [Streptohalobacillus salinus]
MIVFRTVEELVDLAEKEQVKIAEIMIRREMDVFSLSRKAVVNRMDEQLTVMEEAIDRGLKGVASISGLTGYDAVKTQLKRTREEMLDFLFTSGAFGYVVANQAFISGARGGCQAEVGSAAAMAAAAVVEMAKGTPKQSAHAFSITMKNMLGLVCDPVAGLVEVPCVKRNAMGASQAIVSADMALAGVESKIPADEVIGAMYQIGKQMSPQLKETAEGGLANTPTARRLEQEIFAKQS